MSPATTRHDQYGPAVTAVDPDSSVLLLELASAEVPELVPLAEPEEDVLVALAVLLLLLTLCFSPSWTANQSAASSGYDRSR